MILHIEKIILKYFLCIRPVTPLPRYLRGFLTLTFLLFKNLLFWSFLLIWRNISCILLLWFLCLGSWNASCVCHVKLNIKLSWTFDCPALFLFWGEYVLISGTIVPIMIILQQPAPLPHFHKLAQSYFSCFIVSVPWKVLLHSLSALPVRIITWIKSINDCEVTGVFF